MLLINIIKKLGVQGEKKGEKILTRNEVTLERAEYFIRPHKKWCVLKKKPKPKRDQNK